VRTISSGAPAGGITLFIKLMSTEDGQIRVTDAARIQLDGTGGLLLYDFASRIKERIDLAGERVVQILSFKASGLQAEAKRDSAADTVSGEFAAAAAGRRSNWAVGKTARNPLSA
jgi:hypothetical protein